MPRNFFTLTQFQRKRKSLVFFQSINFLWSSLSRTFYHGLYDHVSWPALFSHTAERLEKRKPWLKKNTMFLLEYNRCEYWGGGGRKSAFEPNKTTAKKLRATSDIIPIRLINFKRSIWFWSLQWQFVELLLLLKLLSMIYKINLAESRQITAAAYVQ